MISKPIDALAEIKLYQGNPTLFIYGQPTFFSFIRTSSPTREGYNNTASAQAYASLGLHIYSIGLGTYGTPPEWCGPLPGKSDFFDFSTVETRFAHILKADPQAYFFLRVHLEMPEWWGKMYPEEREILWSGEKKEPVICFHNLERGV